MAEAALCADVLASQRTAKITGKFSNLLPKAANYARNSKICFQNSELTGKLSLEPAWIKGIRASPAPKQLILRRCNRRGPSTLNVVVDHMRESGVPRNYWLHLAQFVVAGLMDVRLGQIKKQAIHSRNRRSNSESQSGISQAAEAECLLDDCR
jgi:hypothetical protein